MQMTYKALTAVADEEYSMAPYIECDEKQGSRMAAKPAVYPCAPTASGTICVPSARAVDPALGFLGRGMIASGERLHITLNSK
jgi:hypothetical protein